MILDHLFSRLRALAPLLTLLAACTEDAPRPAADGDAASPAADAADAAIAADASTGPVEVPTPPPYDGGGCPPGMRELPGGSYVMGGTLNVDERPPHAVTMRVFCIDETEVTVEAYARCVAAGTCAAAGTEAQCNGAVAGRGTHPINCVTFDQAQAFCSFAGKRLPTEEEWEYAARGTDGRIYPWGGFAPTGNACWSGTGNDVGVGNRRSTCPVGSYPAGASPFGLLDMAGNVMEWTAGGYSSSYTAARDPRQPVYRGGSWSHSNLDMLRTTTRVRGTLTDRNSGLGMRCAR